MEQGKDAATATRSSKNQVQFGSAAGAMAGEAQDEPQIIVMKNDYEAEIWRGGKRKRRVRQVQETRRTHPKIERKLRAALSITALASTTRAGLAKTLAQAVLTASGRQRETHRQIAHSKK